MSQKNFASYGDMETLVAEIADKCGPYTEISYEDWLQLTPYQQEHGRWDVTGVPGADGTFSIDLMTKLWENPDTSASFAGQDITGLTTLSDYDLFYITTNTTSTFGSHTFGSDTIYAEHVYPSSIASRGTVSHFRSFTIDKTNNKIIVSDAVKGWADTAATVDNGNLIPYQIYGIKLHHTVEIKSIAPTVSTLAENCVFDPTGTDLESTDVEAAIKELEANFQDGVDDIYDAVVANDTFYEYNLSWNRITESS